MSDFESSLNWVLQKLSIKHELKSEQKQAMQIICSGYHTFVILPTGYGKSYIYGLSPLIMDKVPRCYGVYNYKIYTTMGQFISFRHPILKWPKTYFRYFI